MSVMASDPTSRGETTNIHVPASVLSHRSRSRATQVPRLAPGTYLVLPESEELSVIELDREVTHIGRGFSADVRLEDATVSRRHALIIRHGGVHSILDDRSGNGVQVNGEAVQRKELEDGDRIRLGEVELVFVSVPGAAAAS
jgi:pSer/pThr/pTyr-binding forkhead associated (FHA) protein